MGDNTLSDIKSYTYFDPDNFRKTYPTKFDILLFVTIPNSDNKSNMLLFRDYTKNLPTLGRQKKLYYLKNFLTSLTQRRIIIFFETELVVHLALLKLLTIF